MAVLGALTSLSQTAPIIEQIEADSLILVTVPSALEPYLSYTQNEAVTLPATSDVDRPVARVGYRVQVFDDNNPRTAKAQAQERKQAIENRFPEFHAYLQFNSPYWRVKAGDFRTRSEAEAALAAIRAAFPAYATQLRVVRDRINPR